MFKDKERVSWCQGPGIWASSAPKNLCLVVVRKIYQDGADVREVLRKETYPDWITPVHAFLFYWQHPLTHTSSPRAGCRCLFFPILTLAVCWFPTTSANPRHPQPISLELPSSRLPWAQGPPPATLAEGPCVSPILCPLSLQSTLFNFVRLPFP